MTETISLVLRLAAPMQSWGTSSQFNRRATDDRPSKAGIVGLLACALGRDRGADVDDLTALPMAVRVDQPGTVMVDYHTVSTFDGAPLLSSNTNAKGRQTSTGPAKRTHITRRSYLHDAVFVVVLSGERELLTQLAAALRHPTWALFLGRRSCPPAGPLLVAGPDGDLWTGGAADLLHTIPWQAGIAGRREHRANDTVTLSATIDDTAGMDLAQDVPTGFAPRQRGSRTRPVTHLWIDLPISEHSTTAQLPHHDPFTALEAP